nr:hypothetical protein [Candidatus Contubernalis alkalaceticus]
MFKNMKVGDIDPRARRKYCFTISDKARAVAGGVLEAVLCITSGLQKRVNSGLQKRDKQVCFRKGFG